METSELITKIDELIKLYPSDSAENKSVTKAQYYTLVKQFIYNYFGQDTEFYKALNQDHHRTGDKNRSQYQEALTAWEILLSIRSYISLNLDFRQTEKFRIGIDLISDFMIQAHGLLKDKKYHPAAAAILMGAALEEFLKKLAEKHKIEIDYTKDTISTVSEKLRKLEILNKQDMKDITSWSGIRNDATHGNFSEIDDRKRIKITIEAIDLFMRKYS